MRTTLFSGLMELALQSVLTRVPGLGPKRRRQLLTHFTDLTALKQAGLEELLEVPGLPRPVVENLLNALRDEPTEGAEKSSRK